MLCRVGLCKISSADGTVSVNVSRPKHKNTKDTGETYLTDHILDKNLCKKSVVRIFLGKDIINSLSRRKFDKPSIYYLGKFCLSSWDATFLTFKEILLH